MPNLRFNIRHNIIQGDDLSKVESADDNVMIEYNNYYPAGTHVSASDAIFTTSNGCSVISFALANAIT